MWSLLKEPKNRNRTREEAASAAPAAAADRKRRWRRREAAESELKKVWVCVGWGWVGKCEILISYKTRKWYRMSWNGFSHDWILNLLRSTTINYTFLFFFSSAHSSFHISRQRRRIGWWRLEENEFNTRQTEHNLTTWESSLFRFYTMLFLRLSRRLGINIFLIITFNVYNIVLCLVDAEDFAAKRDGGSRCAVLSDGEFEWVWRVKNS